MSCTGTSESGPGQPVAFDDAGTPADASLPNERDGSSPAAPDAGAIDWFGTPGPWPTAPVTIFGAAQNLDDPEIIDVSTDEGQNIWAVIPRALYLLRPGDTAFRKYGQADGLHLDDAEPPGITAVAGGAPGEVFVGYQGTPVRDPQQDPDRHRGKLDRVQLRENGSLEVTFYDIHNNDALTGMQSSCTVTRLPDGGVDPSGTDWSFNEDRTVMRMLHDHQYHRGTLYVGYSHGVGRIDAGKPSPAHGFDFADHVHPEVINAAGTKRMGEWRALALDPTVRLDRAGSTNTGMLWMGGRWTAGANTWTPDLFGWTNNNYDCPPLYPRHPFWMAISSPPVFQVADGESIYLSGIAVLSSGAVYFASGPGNDSSYAGPFGLAVWRSGRDYFYLSPETDLGLPGRDLVDLQRLPDDTLLLALRSAGLWRWNPLPE
ncbi:MAG: hypothetical protein HY901_10795, partial [Deltaproteobacteria bacterium]|nr:hypothetical protein [Deltaproteobacteria bacterium]